MVQVVRRVKEKFEFSVTSLRPLVYYMTLADINAFFLNGKNSNFKRRCKKLGASLSKYHELLAYKESEEYPDDLVAIAKEQYSEASPEEKFVIHSNTLDRILTELQDKISDLEESNVSYLETEDNCLLSFYGFLPSSWNDTCIVEDWKLMFAAEGRLHIFEYFLEKLKEIRVSVYQPCIERMVGEVNQHYQDTKDLLQKKKDGPGASKVSPHVDDSADKKCDEASEKAVSISEDASIEKRSKRIRTFMNRKLNAWCRR